MFKFLEKVIDRLGREIGHVRALIQLRGCEIARGACIMGPVRLSRQGRVRLGKKVYFRDGIMPTSLSCGEGAEITIGARTMLNYGASLKAARSVQIGEDCLIASFVQIDDAPDGSTAPNPIIIEDNVWIAHGAVIGPGVRIGKNSIVSAGSIVNSDVPADCMAMGNPARCVSLDLISPQSHEKSVTAMKA